MSSTTDELERVIGASRIMAILRGVGVERALELAKTAWDLGIDSVEITLQHRDDLEALRQVVRLGEERGKPVAAGTIIVAEQIMEARAAGAAFLVSPGLDRDLIAAAGAVGIPLVPGVATPTDVQHAVSMGLAWLKAFPAAWLGSEWFRHIRGPFPQVRFVATGGLDARSAPVFLEAGARVVAVGSALEDPAQLPLLAQLAGRL